MIYHASVKTVYTQHSAVPTMTRGVQHRAMPRINSFDTCIVYIFFFIYFNMLTSIQTPRPAHSFRVKLILMKRE